MIETIPHADEMTLDLPEAPGQSNGVENEQPAFRIKEKLMPIAGVESAWLEDLGKTFYVYVIVNDFSNATLHSIFDAQYEVEDEFWHISFHFRINPVDLEAMQSANRIRRLF